MLFALYQEQNNACFFSHQGEMGHTCVAFKKHRTTHSQLGGFLYVKINRCTEELYEEIWV